MNAEIHMYSAVGKVGTVPGCAAGDHHPLLIFLRQNVASEHDLGAAAAAATQRGWNDVDITRAGTLPADAGASMGGAIRDAYEAAVETGEGLMVFAATVQPAPRK